MSPTTKSYKRPAMWRHPRLLRRRLLESWPLLLWMAAIFLVLLMYRGSTRLTALVGAVETVVEPVAPLETARLLAIQVRLGQTVKAGDELARMDTLLFDAATAVDEAQLIEVEGTLQDYQQRVLNFVSSFEEARSKAQFDKEIETVNSKRDDSVLKVLREELTRLDDLKKKGLVTEQDMAALRPQVAALEQTVTAYPALIDIHQRRFNSASEDEKTMRQLLTQGTDMRFDVLEAIKAMRAATDEIIRTTREQRQILRGSYVLRAVRDGVVSQIFHQPGDVVTAGDPIIRLVGERPERIIGFLPEIHLGDMKVGDPVWIWRQNGESGHIEAVIESIAPEIETLPGRVSPIRGDPLRGRRLVLSFPAGQDLLPGETVRLQLPALGWAGWFERLTVH